MKKTHLKLFVSYSHKDKKHKEELLTHLKSLQLTHNIDVWHDGEITAGDEISQSVLKELESSNVVLLLISPYFLASCYCIEVELKKAIERYHRNECIIVPVILSESMIDNTLSFYDLMRVPEDGKAIQKFRPQSDGYVDAVSKIKKMIDVKFPDARKTR